MVKRGWRVSNSSDYPNSRKNKNSIKAIIAVLAVVVLVIVIVLITSPNLQLSPKSGSYLDGPNSKAILSAVGVTKGGSNPASKWFASRGKTSFKDLQGNVYGEDTYKMLIASLDPAVVKEYTPGFSFKPFARSTSTPTSTPVRQQPLPKPTQTSTPRPTASVSASATASGSPK